MLHHTYKSSKISIADRILIYEQHMRRPMSTSSFYVTTPIYYVNDVPHVGHAYTTLAADTLARWHQLLGQDTYFLTGTDEHGLKIEQAAAKSNVHPQTHVDHYSKRFLQLCDLINTHPNDFIRTTEQRHKDVVTHLWQCMCDAGDIYLGEYSGWYSVSDEAYFTEDELVNGKAPSGHEVTWMVEKSYFFKLSKYTQPLLDYLENNPNFIQPRKRFNEVKSFVSTGLRDISISRSSFSWGIPVPKDPKHIMYVWVDALSNYVSALGGPEGDLYTKFWTQAHHIIGKDILRFHAVYWPCFLMSAGLPLPHRIIAHGWWVVEGEKMSKSKNNAVDPHVVVNAVGSDAFRYFLLREVPFGSDGDFSEKALLTRINSDLANDYGNLLNRTLGMLKKYRTSRLPVAITTDHVLWGEFEQELYLQMQWARGELVDSMNHYKFHDALRAIWSLVSASNRYVDRRAPWVLAKAGESHAAVLDMVLYNLCEALRMIGIWTQPFLPEKSATLLECLQVNPNDRHWANTETWGQLQGDVTVLSQLSLFPRVEGPLCITRAQVEAQKNPTSSAKIVATPTISASSTSSASQMIDTSDTAGIVDIKDTVEFDDFMKLDLRVAQIMLAEKHPNADRLLKLTVNVGETITRTVCAGIAQAYQPEELVGKKVVLLANLKARKIRGILSQGMLLAGGSGADIRVIMMPDILAVGTQIS
jgi:methionyl-tRNA synthetase